MATSPNRKERARDRKDRRLRVDEATKIARLVLPEGQAERGGFAVADVANHSESDQRHMVRSGEKRTVRRLTRVERLKNGGVLTTEQAIACEWYVDAWELGLATSCVTANYGGVGGGRGASDHAAHYAEQQMARENYLWAREAVPEWLRPTFEAVLLDQMSEQALRKVINGKGILKARLKLAAALLYDKVNYLVSAG